MTFLRERMESVVHQTFSDWELLIVDSSSTDGTREFLEREYVSRDPRMKLYQAPPGLYQAWNFGLEKAVGKYLYIATSDDTMVPECLERMVAALETHPECDLCDSVLKLIDEEGRELGVDSEQFLPHYWHVDFPRDKQHVRLAPHDYFLHLSGKTVYTSMTQIMFRRSLCDKIGLFHTGFGSSADYLWGMKASLYANVIFLPEKLSSWRIHSRQATGQSTAQEIDRRFHEMLQMAQSTLPLIRDPGMRKMAKSQMRIVDFKEKLLPAKRKARFFNIVKCLFAAFSTHPILLAEFTVFSLKTWGKVPRKFWLIYTYDMLFRHRFEKLHLSHCIRMSEVPAGKTE